MPMNDQDKKIVLELSVEQAGQMGLMMDAALRATGVQFVDIVVELRNQVRSQWQTEAQVPAKLTSADQLSSLRPVAE